MKHDQEYYILKLKTSVESRVGQKIRTPKDFDWLSACIIDKVHQNISPTTLKRVWGYLSASSVPRESTLDICVQFIDYKNWADFCNGIDQEEQTAAMDETEPTVEEPVTDGAYKKWGVAVTVIVAFVLILFGFQQFVRSRQLPASVEAYVLKQGQRFANYHDYLRLFGISDSATYWGRVLPHYPNIVVWGPEYHHPHWLNDGNRTQMMPTITERWTSEQADSAWVVMRNADKYRHDQRLNEVRITFMKNLVDTGYVFLGVYRLSLSQSDTTQCVWERVADECDLSNLDYLEELRN